MFPECTSHKERHWRSVGEARDGELSYSARFLTREGADTSAFFLLSLLLLLAMTPIRSLMRPTITTRWSCYLVE
jgi:hypothetical protein